jgi:hypothetical protein
VSEPNTKTKRAQVVVNAEAAKYSAAVKLLAECVYCSVFTVERLKAKINKKLNAVAKHKRSGGTIVAALLNESSYGSDSNYVANSVVNQARHTLLYLSVSLSPSLPLSLSLSLSLSHTHTLSLSLSEPGALPHGAAGRAGCRARRGMRGAGPPAHRAVRGQRPGLRRPPVRAGMAPPPYNTRAVI